MKSFTVYFEIIRLKSVQNTCLCVLIGWAQFYFMEPIYTVYLTQKCGFTTNEAGYMWIFIGIVFSVTNFYCGYFLDKNQVNRTFIKKLTLSGCLMSALIAIVSGGGLQLLRPYVNV